jgi:hypothetical protein
MTAWFSHIYMMDCVLAEIATIWPQLPDHIRVGILAMVKAAAERTEP